MNTQKSKRYVIDANSSLVHANMPYESVTLFTEIVFTYTKHYIRSHLLCLMSAPIDKLLRKIFGTASLHADILQNDRKWVENGVKHLELLKSSTTTILPENKFIRK